MHHGLDRVRNQLTREQRELHALVVHADTVGDRNGSEFARRAARLRYSRLGRIDLEIVSHVTGCLFTLHADDPDHRLGKGLIIEPHRSHEGAVRRTIEPIGRHPRSQLLHALSPLASANVYCSGATMLGCLNCATSIFGSIPVAA